MKRGIVLFVFICGIAFFWALQPAARSKMKKYAEKVSSDADIEIYQNLETGEPTWETEVRETEIICFTVYEGSIYTSANDGNIYCLELETGTCVWRAEHLQPGFNV